MTDPNMEREVTREVEGRVYAGKKRIHWGKVQYDYGVGWYEGEEVAWEAAREAGVLQVVEVWVDPNP